MTAHDATGEAIAKIDKALQHVYDICQGRQTWRMRIPADSENDSDLILCEALESARKLLSAASETPQIMSKADFEMIASAIWHQFAGEHDVKAEAEERLREIFESQTTPSATPRSEFDRMADVADKSQERAIQAIQQNVELELDAQRLDWIEEKRATVSFSDLAPEHGSPGGPHVCANSLEPLDDANHYYGSTYREAIDKAMKGTRS